MAAPDAVTYERNVATVMRDGITVWPNGFAQNLTSGIFRLRYRKSEEKPELATYALKVESRNRPLSLNHALWEQ
jgi:hypothetical protein